MIKWFDDIIYRLDVWNIPYEDRGMHLGIRGYTWHRIDVADISLWIREDGYYEIWRRDMRLEYGGIENTDKVITIVERIMYYTGMKRYWVIPCN